MTKKIFSMVGFVLFVGTVVFGVSINLSNGVNLSDLTLSNIQILAKSEDPNVECPGGYCVFDYNDGNSCYACCPVGKNTRCTPNGCSCS